MFMLKALRSKAFNTIYSVVFSTCIAITKLVRPDKIERARSALNFVLTDMTTAISAQGSYCVFHLDFMRGAIAFGLTEWQQASKGNRSPELGDLSCSDCSLLLNPIDPV